MENPTFWYELLADRDEPKSDSWYYTVDDALDAIRDYWRTGITTPMRLSWETRAGQSGVIAEGAALDRWALARGDPRVG